jgi:xanthine/CO dehydrogenase XdhC/CoxF family maturation factor
MRELTQIVEAFEQLCADGGAAALATVAAVEGSSYRRPGARMLVAADGRTWGGVSGGCLESDVARRGRLLIASPSLPMVCRYETGGDLEDEATLIEDEPSLSRQPGPSLGCGGLIDILIERISAQSPGPLPALSAAVRTRRAAAVATIVRVGGGNVHANVRLGQRLIQIAGDRSAGDVVDPTLHAAMLCDLETNPHPPALLRRHHLTDNCWADVLVERLLPPQALVIFGDGHDIEPLVLLARSLGWHVTVVGNRRRSLPVDQFVQAAGDDPAAGLAPLSSDAAVVIMAHHLRKDAAVLRTLLQRPPRYLGLLGPRHRTERLLAEAGEAAQACRDRLFAPVGLDIGAETPEQIALAVLAEIQAVICGRGGGSLRDRSGPIHRPFPPPVKFRRARGIGLGSENLDSPPVSPASRKGV